MKNPPGYGSIVDLGKKRRPIAVRVPNGKKINKQGKEIIDYKYLEYFERIKQGKIDAQTLLAQYTSGINADIPKAANVCPTFQEMADKTLRKCPPPPLPTLRRFCLKPLTLPGNKNTFPRTLSMTLIFSIRKTKAGFIPLSAGMRCLCSGSTGRVKMC